MACVLGVSLLSILVRIENDNLSQALLPHWLPLFAIGMLTFQFIVGHFRPLVFMPLLGVLAGICWSVLGPQQTIAGLLTAFAILGFRFRAVPSLFRPLALAGTISYSIYLVHTPFGMRVINLAVRLPADTAYRYMAVIVALFVSVISAALFWKFVELPAQRWARTGRSP